MVMRRATLALASAAVLVTAGVAVGLVRSHHQPEPPLAASVASTATATLAAPVGHRRIYNDSHVPAEIVWPREK